MTVTIDIDGEEAEAVAFDGKALTLSSPRALAPGAPVGFSAVLGGQRWVFDGRTIGSKRIEATRFEVKIRLVNLRRGAREALRGSLGPRV